MNNSFKGILATTGAVIFCGLPGLMMSIIGIGKFILGDGHEQSPTLIILILIGISLILILVPVVVWFLTIHRKTKQPESE